LQKSNSRKSQPPPKKDFGSKSPYFRKKDIRREDANESLQKHHEMESRQELKGSQKFYQSKPQKLENIIKPLEDNINKEESNIVSVDESNIKNTEAKDKDNHDDDINSCVNDVKDNEVCLNLENKLILQNSDLLVCNTETEIIIYEANKQLENKMEELQIVQISTAAASEIIKIDSFISSAKDNKKDNDGDNDENEIKSAENSLYDISNNNNDVLQDKKQDPPMEETEIIVNNTCDSKQIKNIDEQDSNIKCKTKDSPEEKNVDKIVILSSTIISSVAKENNELNSNDSSLKEKNVSFAKMQSATANEQINVDQQDAIKSANKTQECTSNDKKENSVANGIVVDKIKFPKEDVQVEDKKIISLSNREVEIEK